MNLLPKSKQDFSKKDYWNTFFEERGKKAFEWYGDYPELCGHLHKYIKPKDDILVIGCGNSTISTDLYDVGYRNITNIDISKVVIRQMQTSNNLARPDMKYLLMDALAMTFTDETFSVVLDKGTLDALMADNSAETSEKIDQLFKEISRVLRTGGRYVCVSLLQDHILKKLLEYFPTNNWMFRIVRCLEAEQKTIDDNDGIAMPVFVVVATKFKKLPQLVLETCMAGDKMQRMNSTEDMFGTVREAQQASLVIGKLNHSSVANDPIVLELCNPADNKTRFTIHVLDKNNKGNIKKFAAFIVPQGRESEWLFSTSEGRENLLQSAGFDRLAIVLLHREQKYNGWDEVQEELTESIKRLKPRGCSSVIPFVSLGSNVGSRILIHKGCSELSGEYIIEEVESDDVTLRRLVFLNNQFVVQSEAAIKTIKTRNNKQKQIIDIGNLSCQHHIYMTVGIFALLADLKAEETDLKTNKKQKDSSFQRIAVIGLGGGGLCTFVHKCFRELVIEAVEIDPEIVKIATDYFGLQQDKNFKVVIQDGIEFIMDAAKNDEKYSAILFDVDSKDSSIGMSCPPKEFLEQKLLSSVKKCIGLNGIFVLNLSCRDKNLRIDVLKSLKQIFNSICTYKLEQDLNEIIYCTNQEQDWKNIINNAATYVNEMAIKSKLKDDEIVDVTGLLENLDIV